MKPTSDHPKKNKNERRQLHLLIFLIILFLLLSSFLLFLIMQNGIPGVFETESLPEEEALQDPETEAAFEAESKTESETASETETVTEAVTEAVTEQETSAETEEAGFAGLDPANLREEEIYTFLQGPKAWKTRTDWSGLWYNKDLAGQKFSAFGCGLCALASIYSTLTPYECSPLDMYEYAQEVSDYAPVSGFGAIDWPYLKKTLSTVGIRSTLKRKDKEYRQFQENMANSICAIVLVCSANDSTYWQNVEGHYVTVWLYNEEDDTVFLSDSGNPDHNRQRVPLKLLYDAMKTSSHFQYMRITDVDPDANTWQHDGIIIRWRRPKYLD